MSILSDEEIIKITESMGNIVKCELGLDVNKRYKYDPDEKTLYVYECVNYHDWQEDWVRVNLKPKQIKKIELAFRILSGM